MSYEAAINNLQIMADKDFANGAPHRGEFRAAIRLLEAAGFMQPEDIIWLRHQVDRIEEYSPLPGCVCPGRSRKDRFDALIEALPDAPQEKEGKVDKSLMKIANDLGISFSAAKICYDQGFKDAIEALPKEEK